MGEKNSWKPTNSQSGRDVRSFVVGISNKFSTNSKQILFSYLFLHNSVNDVWPDVKVAPEPSMI